MSLSNFSYMVHCEPCGHKSYLTEEDMKLLSLVPRSKIQKHIPVLENGKTKPSEFVEQTKKTKCKKCGRGVVIRRLAGAIKDSIKAIREQEHKKAQDSQFDQRVKDGQPVRRQDDEKKDNLGT